MNKTIWLIRHGESQANAGLSTHSPESICLTIRGQEQAELLADYFKDKPDSIIVSPFLRTRQTAQPLIDKFPSVPVQEWSIQEFTYLDTERCQNTTLHQRKPLVEEYWKRNDARYCDGTGAESFSDFFNRIVDTIEKIKSSEYQSTIVFTHAQFIRTMMWILLTGKKEIDNRTMQQVFVFLSSIAIPNTGIVSIQLEENKEYISHIITDHLPQSILSY